MFNMQYQLQYFVEEKWVEQCPLNLTEENNIVDDCEFCTHFVTINFDTINKDSITEVHRSGEELTKKRVEKGRVLKCGEQR